MHGSCGCGLDAPPTSTTSHSASIFVTHVNQQAAPILSERFSLVSRLNLLDELNQVDLAPRCVMIVEKRWTLDQILPNFTRLRCHTCRVPEGLAHVLQSHLVSIRLQTALLGHNFPAPNVLSGPHYLTKIRNCSPSNEALVCIDDGSCLVCRDCRRIFASPVQARLH